MKNLLLATASGILLAFAWPTYGIPLLLFIAFVPLLLAEYRIRHSQLKQKRLVLFGCAYTTFFIWNFVTTSWLWFADPFGASFAVLVNSLLMSIIILIYYSVAKRSSTNKALLFLITLWISFEKMHLGWEFSWPWLNLGNGFSEHIKWIQWYEYTGTFGGTLWVWLLNAIIFSAVINYRKSRRKVIIRRTALFCSLLILIPIALSMYLYQSFKPQGPNVDVVVLQPNIDPYSEKYNVSNIKISELLIELANTKISDSTDFIIAPETVFADNVRISQFKNSVFKYKLDRYIQEHPNANLLSGISFIDFITDPEKVSTQSNFLKDKIWYDDYNSAMLINVTDSVQLYHKSKLVVGVENFPYQSVLKPLIGDAMIDLGGTVAMKTTQDFRDVFTGVNPIYKAGPIICYESVYGEFVTGYVKNGANFLAIVTNDAWWKNTQGHKQHLSYARLRAIETRRPIARSANTGISALITAKGEITNTLAYSTQGALSGTLATNESKTFYTKTGDYIARISVFIMLFVLLITFFRRKK